MICPTCNKEVEKISDTNWECPGVHAQLVINNDKLVSYRIFFEYKGRMHKLRGANDETTLLKRSQGKHSHYYDYDRILSIPKLVELIIEDNILQIERMMDKLKKLVIFS